MLGNMMNNQLLISGVIEHAEKYHSDAEIVSRTVEGPIHRYTYSDAAKRSRKLANALVNLGLKEGDTIGTLAWNTFRHFELYFGVSGIGCVVNTVNPRLFPEQLIYIINHAENQYLFVDLSFVELVESLESTFDSVKGFVILTDKEHMPDTGWFLIMEQQSKQDFLVYEKDNRVAIININPSKKGSTAVMAVGPRSGLN